MTHVDDFLFVEKSDRIEELFLSKLSHYTKFTGGGTCNDRLDISFTYETNELYLNHGNKIDLYCNELKVTKPMSSLSIDFNGLKSGVEVLENRDLYLKAIGYLNYLSLSSRPDIMCDLLGTKSRSLFYQFNDGSESASSIIDVYVDASFKSPQE